MYYILCYMLYVYSVFLNCCSTVGVGLFTVAIVISCSSHSCINNIRGFYPYTQWVQLAPSGK